VIGFRKSQLKPSFLPRWLEWTTFALFVLAIGPAIAGVLVGIFGSVAFPINMDKFHWSIPVFTIGFSVVLTYLAGLLIAAPALVFFILLYSFFRKGSLYIAIGSGVLSSIFVLTARFVWTARALEPVPASITELGQQIAALATLSAITAAICWYQTKHLHRLP
jgi:hypothetical protein